MSFLDWAVFATFLSYVVIDGARRAGKNTSAADLFLAGRSAPWWVMGISIMATQASAITMIGTTGTGWREGTRFLQFYYALPLAMVILAFTIVPLFHRHRVFTAYEYLGIRFGRGTRLLSAGIFLVLRGLSAGVVIYAPSVVLAALLDIDERIAISAMGGVAVLYTSLGGMRAVLSTDVKQFAVMVMGLAVAAWCVVRALPEDVGLGGALEIAAASGRLELVDLRWDPAEKYTLWSSLLGGLFLFLAYFGTDQSQVQRLLAGRSIAHERGALLFNALLKVPFQLVVLGTGALLFVFYIFHAPPQSFVPAERTAATGAIESDGHDSSTAEGNAFAESRARAAAACRAYLARLPAGDETARTALLEALASYEETRRVRRLAAAGQRGQLDASGRPRTSEVNYVFPSFVLDHLPAGLVGLLIAAIFAAALSSVDSALNSLATVAVMDGYCAGFRQQPSERKRLLLSRSATALLGALATLFALYAGRLGSVIEAVNEVGSYFYGSLLGVFVLALAFPRVGGAGAVCGLLAGMVSVSLLKLASEGDIAFLYLNTAGTAACLLTGVLVSVGARLWPRAGTA